MSSIIHAVQPSMESDSITQSNYALNSTVGHGAVLLDANFVLNSLWRSNEKHILHRLVENRIKIYTTSTLSREQDKVLRNSTRVIDEQSSQLLSRHLIVLRDDSSDVHSEAEHIDIHRPDDIHIATAKVNGVSLLSSDLEMIRVATDAGVPSYCPDNFALFYMNRFSKSRLIRKPAETSPAPLSGSRLLDSLRHDGLRNHWDVRKVKTGLRFRK